MEDNQNPVVFAVQSAVLEMLESVEYITQNDTPERKEELQQEVQKTVLMFIAAIVLANRQFEPSKWPFLSILVDWRDLPGGEVRYLNEYATRWVESSKSAPKFFDAAIQFDSYNHTGIARAMLRQIQLIGNTVSASDGNVSPAELGTVSDYIAFLENKMFAIRSQEISESLVETKLTEVIQDENRAQPQPQSSYIKPPVISQRNRIADLRWLTPVESIKIGCFDISAGMIYVSDGQPSVEEASAINLRLPIGQASRTSGPLSYYPQYKWLTPDQRAVYLDWLAGGRKDEIPESRELGYVFLFFYGLERRLIVDKIQDREVVAEIVRLLQHYGTSTRSRSLHSYTSQLIHFWGWQQGIDYYGQLLEWMKTLPVALLGDDEIAIILAYYFQKGNALPTDLAYELASRSFDSRRSVIVTRVNTEFRSLFLKRYLEKYSGGLNLKQAARSIRLQYRPASPSLLYNRSAFSIQIPDVIGLPSQFKELSTIWNSCVENLSSYSRAKSKGDDLSAGINAYMALPMELRIGSPHPLAKRWEDALMVARPGNGCSIIEVVEVAKLLDISQHDKLSHGQSRDLAEIIESLGFGVEPDARYDGAYAWDQELAVYKPIDSKVTAPSDNYRGASVLLKLCVLVAGADGHVASEELNVSRHFIEKNLTLSPEDQQRLEVLEQVLVLDPSRVKGSLVRIATPIPKGQRELICEVLVHVAAADNVITKDEIRTLARIFKAFGLSNDKLELNLKSVSTEFREVTIQTGGSRIPGEAIPAPSQPFRINMARVDQIAQETSEVIGILSKVMVEDESENVTPIDNGQKKSVTVTQATNVSEKQKTVDGPPDWLQSLDSKYHQVLLHLIEQDSWKRADFDALVKKFQLMPLNAFDAINEWADENLGDFILEGDDPILVHKESIP